MNLKLLGQCLGTSFEQRADTDLYKYVDICVLLAEIKINIIAILLYVLDFVSKKQHEIWH